MNYWLFKSEPETYSIDDLIKKPNCVDHWDGIRNYQARNMIRDDIKIGDNLFFYNSSCKVPGIVGTMEVVREAYPDYTAFDANSPYYDPKSDAENPRWVMVDVKFKRKFDKIISLSLLKSYTQLSDMHLLRKGNRLSILPVSKTEWEFINSLKM